MILIPINWGKSRIIVKLSMLKKKQIHSNKELSVIGYLFPRVESYEAIGDLEQYNNYVNVHLYQRNHWPGSSGWEDHEYGSITWSFN